MVKLTDKKIKWAVKQVINKGESTEVVAKIYGVSRRRIQQLVKYYRETGEYPMLDKKRRPKTHLSGDEKRIIEDAYNESFLGARLLRFHIQKHYKRNILHNKIHIPLKRNNTQTNGKIERWFQEYRRHRWRFDSAYAFAEWYNNRVHGALDLEYFETPNDAFIGKMRSENTLGMFFEWSEREVSL